MSSISRPIQIDEFTLALRDVQDHELYAVKEQLTKSIAKLDKTNKKLEKLAQGETLDSDDDEFDHIDQDDKHLFHEIIAENDIVARNQRLRIEKVDDELSHRGLSRANVSNAAQNGIVS